MDLDRGICKTPDTKKRKKKPIHSQWSTGKTVFFEIHGSNRDFYPAQLLERTSDDVVLLYQGKRIHVDPAKVIYPDDEEGDPSQDAQNGRSANSPSNDEEQSEEHDDNENASKSPHSTNANNVSPPGTKRRDEEIDEELEDETHERAEDFTTSFTRTRQTSHRRGSHRKNVECDPSTDQSVQHPVPTRSSVARKPLRGASEDDDDNSVRRDRPELNRDGTPTIINDSEEDEEEDRKVPAKEVRTPREDEHDSRRASPLYDDERFTARKDDNDELSPGPSDDESNFSESLSLLSSDEEEEGIPVAQRFIDADFLIPPDLARFGVDPRIVLPFPSYLPHQHERQEKKPHQRRWSESRNSSKASQDGTSRRGDLKYLGGIRNEAAALLSSVKPRRLRFSRHSRRRQGTLRENDDRDESKRKRLEKDDVVSTSAEDTSRQAPDLSRITQRKGKSRNDASRREEKEAGPGMTQKTRRVPSDDESTSEAIDEKHLQNRQLPSKPGELCDEESPNENEEGIRKKNLNDAETRMKEQKRESASAPKNHQNVAAKVKSPLTRPRRPGEVVTAHFVSKNAGPFSVGPDVSRTERRKVNRTQGTHELTRKTQGPELHKHLSNSPRHAARHKKKEDSSYSDDENEAISGTDSIAFATQPTPHRSNAIYKKKEDSSYNDDENEDSSGTDGSSFGTQPTTKRQRKEYLFNDENVAKKPGERHQHKQLARSKNKDDSTYEDNEDSEDDTESAGFSYVGEESDEEENDYTVSTQSSSLQDGSRQRSPCSWTSDDRSFGRMSESSKSNKHSASRTTRRSKNANSSERPRRKGIATPKTYEESDEDHHPPSDPEDKIEWKGRRKN